MKKISIYVLLIVSLLSLAACRGYETGSEVSTDTTGEDKNMVKETELIMLIDGNEVGVEWEDNRSVAALKDLAPLTVQMSMYGGFEQVGPLGEALPDDDVQTQTKAGDIVLYSGDQIVVFYGSNSWAYTRLGRIKDKTSKELSDILGKGDVTLTLQYRR